VTSIDTMITTLSGYKAELDAATPTREIYGVISDQMQGALEWLYKARNPDPVIATDANIPPGT